MGLVKVRVSGVQGEINMDEDMFFTVDEMNETIQELKKRWPKARVSRSMTVGPLPDGRKAYLVHLTLEGAPHYLGNYRRKNV